MLTQESLKEALNYNPETGIFTWRSIKPKSNRKIGDYAGTIMPNGYLRVGIDKKYYFLHRIAMLYVNGIMPIDFEVDHINGIRDDNRISNLRLVTSNGNRQNQRIAHSNNKSGLLGVSFVASKNKFKARIAVDGITINLGYFADKQDAHLAYLRKKIEVHPFCTIGIGYV